MQRRLLPLLALVCLSVVVSADFADNIYDGSLTPFSYAELQAEMTPATPFAGSNPVFLAPESFMETNAAAVARAQALARAQAAARAQAGSPVAFPFQQPPLPADLALQGRAASPYDGMAFTQNEMLQRLASTVDAAVANAPGQYRDMAPLGLVEANSMIRGVNPMDSMPLVAPGTPAAMPQIGMPSAEEMTRDPTEAQTISASATEPINSGMRLKQVSGSVSAPPPALPSSSIMSGLSGSSSAPALPSTSSGSAASASSQLPSISSALSSLGSPSSTSASGSASVSSGSASASRSGSSSVTPISDSKPKPRHRCIPKGNNACVVDIDPKTVEWKVVTVPRGANEGSQVEDLQSQSRAFSQQSKSGSSSASQSALVGESAYQQEYSENPTIAAAQKAFYEKQDELMKEKRWIADVKRIIDEYNIKIRNVQRHTSIEEMELNKSRKNIVNMIKAEKAKKLEGELQAALESLKKLEMTSQALNNKMGELTQTKQGLQTTISKIQKVIGGAKSSGALLETQATVTDSHLHAQQDANEGAKQLFASLIQLVSKAQQKTTDKEAALRAAYDDHHAPRRSDVPMHTHGTHLRALRDREARAHANEAMVDLAEIDSKAHSIADKYAAEENKRMHTNFPLHTLALKDMRKANDDDIFLDF